MRNGKLKQPNGIINADCYKSMKDISRNSVQLVITSPPYNIGKEYEKKISFSNYLKDQEKILRECVRILKDEGSICWQVGTYVKKGYEIIPLDIPIYNICNKLGLKLRNRIVWRFEHGLHATKKFSGRYETILWFTKSNNYKFNLDDVRVPQKYPGKLSYKGKNKGNYSGNIKGKNPSDVWNIPNVKSFHVEKTIHPCQFPIELAERLILSLSDKNDLVLDPYAGVGTTIIAAKKNGRNGLGFEIVKKYVSIAKKRLKQLKEGNLPYRKIFSPIKVITGNSKLLFRKK
jgi:DNA modification methylase